MEHLLTVLQKLMHQHELPGLLIGGHAVTALGHPRATFDIDLLIPRSSREPWKKQILKLHYQPFSDTSNFLQFEAPPNLPLPAIDLMLVDDDVFEVILADKTNIQPIPTPSTQAIIALKLHAINQPSREDTSKDWSDILALIEAHNLTLDDSDFAAIVTKHGGENAIQKITDHLSR